MRTFISIGHFFKKVKAIEKSLFLDIKAIDLDDFLSLRKPSLKKFKNTKEEFPKKKNTCWFFLAQKIISSQGEFPHE